MNRDALDQFFANADDVLADWHGSFDAMTCNADGEIDDPADSPYIAAIYDLGRYGIVTAAEAHRIFSDVFGVTAPTGRAVARAPSGRVPGRRRR